MVGVMAPSVTADVGDAALVIVGGGYACVTVGAGVCLASGHEVGECWEGGWIWRWRH